MGVISFKHRGNLKNIERMLDKASSLNIEKILSAYGEKGVQALSSATPIDTGLTARSWYYNIRKNSGSYSLQFMNSNVNQGVPIAILVQYGHVTRSGTFVQGRDFINPALQPIFDNMAEEIWREVRG